MFLLTNVALSVSIWASREVTTRHAFRPPGGRTLKMIEVLSNFKNEAELRKAVSKDNRFEACDTTMCDNENHRLVDVVSVYDKCNWDKVRKVCTPDGQYIGYEAAPLEETFSSDGYGTLSVQVEEYLDNNVDPDWRNEQITDKIPIHSAEVTSSIGEVTSYLTAPNDDEPMIMHVSPLDDSDDGEYDDISHRLRIKYRDGGIDPRFVVLFGDSPDGKTAIQLVDRQNASYVGKRSYDDDNYVSYFANSFTRFSIEHTDDINVVETAAKQEIASKLGECVSNLLIIKVINQCFSKYDEIRVDLDIYA